MNPRNYVQNGPTPFALKTFIQPKSKMVDRCVCEVKDISSIVDSIKNYICTCTSAIMTLKI